MEIIEEFVKTMTFSEIIAKVLWYCIPLTPLLTISILWKYKELTKSQRIIWGIILASFLSVIFYGTSMIITITNAAK